MGGCCAPEDYTGNDAENSNKQTYKILFLGSGGCGKSTLFKQLRKLYGEGFTNKDKKDAVHGIAAFVVETMQTLLEDEKCNIDELKDQDAIKAGKQIQSIQTNSSITLTEEISENIKILWAQDEIKDIFDETVCYISVSRKFA